VEGSQEWELHADHVKRITGGDMLVARAMRSDIMVKRVPEFTPLIVCNEVPRIKGADRSIRNRLLTLEFFQSLPRDREDISRKEAFMHDPDTRAALLTRLVSGCIKAYSEGLADMPVSFIEAGMRTFDALSHITEFLDQLRDEGALTEVYPDNCSARSCWKASDLHEAYIMWVRRHEDTRHMLGMRKFNETLREMGWETMKAGGVRWLGKQTASFVS
jgi:phage/plasmid-associated DNA primase